MARDYIERRESYEGLDGYKLGWITICHGRLHNDGVDVTPAAARLATGELARIRTGELEEHIVADVAWAASSSVESNEAGMAPSGAA